MTPPVTEQVPDFGVSIDGKGSKLSYSTIELLATSAEVRLFSMGVFWPVSRPSFGPVPT